MNNILDNLPPNIKNTMRNNAYDLVEVLIEEKTPFRLVLWNMDDWDYDLPLEIIEKFPVQIVIDVSGTTLNESYVDDNNGEIIINTYFNNIPYSKLLRDDEILAILDKNGNPFIVNNFKPEGVIDEYIKTTKNPLTPLSKKDIIKMVILEGVSEENANKSMDAFINNNPDLLS